MSDAGAGGRVEQDVRGAAQPTYGRAALSGMAEKQRGAHVDAERNAGVGLAPVWGTSEPARANFWRYWVFDDPSWDWWSFDFDRDVARADERVGGSCRSHQRRPVAVQATRCQGDRLSGLAGSRRERARHDLLLRPHSGHRAVARRVLSTSACSSFRVWALRGWTRHDELWRTAGRPGRRCDHDLLAALDAWSSAAAPPTNHRLPRRRRQDRAHAAALPVPATRRLLRSGSTDDATSFACR